ncbi:hypothetical protein [Bacillus sp. T33-2]|nr:hypothetical protein [Bacillus sp. T33-2]
MSRWAGKLSIITAMKDKNEPVGWETVYHNGYEGQKRAGGLGNCPSKRL